MFSLFERQVAFRYLRARRQEGFLSIIAGFSFLGITLGVATLIIVMSVMNGFRSELLGRILGFNGHLGVYSVNPKGLENYESLVELLKRNPAIASVTPLIERQVMVTNQHQAGGAMVHGIRLDDLKQRALIADHIMAGNLDDFERDDAVVIGRRMAEKFFVQPGSSLSLISPKGTATAFGVVPRARQFTVVAIFEAGMSEYDSASIFIPLPTAQKFFQTGMAVSGVEVFLHHPDSVQAVQMQIMGQVGPDMRSMDWKRANASFFNALQVERNVMFIILTLIILIATFNIISNLTMLVKDKTHDIAIMRTLGATRGAIMRIFFLAGATIGTVGTFGGVALGLAFSYNIETIRQWLQSLTGTNLFNAEIYFLSRLPAEVNPREVIAVVCMSLGLSFLGTLFPAWRAARLDPVEALRYE